MRILIAGCGRVGSLLATRLALEDNAVAVIDQDEHAFNRLGRSFSGSTHCGKVFDRETLNEAGIDHADAFVAVTSGDNSNIVSAVVAKDVFRVPRVISRIYDPRRAEIYRRLGVPAVSSVSWSANEILSMLVHAGFETERTFGDGEVRLVTVQVPLRLVGRIVDELNRPGEISVVAVVRSGKSFLPTGGAPLESGDCVSIAVADTALGHLERMLTP